MKLKIKVNYRAVAQALIGLALVAVGGALVGLAEVDPDINAPWVFAGISFAAIGGLFGGME